jgi:hypothetical protein
MKRRNFLASIVGLVTAAIVRPQAAAVKPLGLAHIVNTQGGFLVGMSRCSYPDLNAPVLSCRGHEISAEDFERLKRLITYK